MCEPWNEFELKKPPQLTVAVTAKDAQNARHVSSAIQRHLQCCKKVNTEFAQTAALLSRLITRRKNSFRRIIGFRAILKLNAALCRLLRIDLPRDLTTFRNSLPDFELDEGCCELPTRNSYDYLLVRVVGVQRVHQRIRTCCQDAAEYFAKMVRNNFFMDTNALLLAVLAKLYSLSAILGNQCVELYNKLVLYRKHFPLVGSYTFLPADYTLPEKLPTFVEQPLTELPQSTTDTVIKLSKELISPSSIPLTTPLFKQHRKVDMGTEVIRESVTSKKTSFIVDTELASVQQARRFITAEYKARKRSITDCITKKIPPHEWLGATKLFKRKLLANEDKKALSIFRKFINSKI